MKSRSRSVKKRSSPGKENKPQAAENEINKPLGEENLSKSFLPPKHFYDSPVRLFMV